MKLLIVVGALVAVVLMNPLTAPAQNPRPSCGTMAEANEDLAAFGRYFRDVEYAPVRKTAIRQLQASEPQSVVTNAGTCRSVQLAALRMLRRYEPTWPQVEQHGYDFTVFRYGPYYAILIKYNYDPQRPEGPAYLPLIVFRAQGLEYVTTILT